MSVPVELLFGSPSLSSVVPSPDGSRLAYLAPVDGVLNAFVADRSLGHARQVTHDTGRGLTQLHWCGERLLWLQDIGGDENHHLHVVELATGEVRDLTPYDGVQARLLGLGDEKACVALNRLDPAVHVPSVIDLGTGEEIPSATGDVALTHLVDEKLDVRVAFTPTASGEVSIDVDGRSIDLLEPGDLISVLLGRKALSHDGSTMYVLSAKDRDTVALVSYDTASGTRGVLHASPQCDVADFSTSPVDGTADLVCVLTDRRRWSALTESLEPMADLLAQLPGDVETIARSRDDLTWVVRTVRDSGPAQLSLLDRVAMTTVLLGSDRPDLDGASLGSTEAFSFTARDGLTVHGYLTRPPGASAAPLPAVLWVHGGPWERDRWGYSPYVQLFATRGYACIQVNFRGSTGYGKAFVDAGDREWGAAMQQDLDDAVAHLVGLGVVDPDRLAIAGGSYGGYATLMGLVTTPEQFRCAIAFVAPANLLTLLESFPPYWASTLTHWHRRVGHPVEDRDLLWDRSPLAHVDRIVTPLLLVHGANDPRVKQAESDALAAALRERGLPCEYHVVPDEGHGFTQPANNTWLLSTMASFLQQHLQ